MVKRWSLALIVSLLVAVVAMPVAAAPDLQSGVHFGPYTVASGDSVSGDLTVFGGPVVLEEDATFDGALTVFGPCSIAVGAQVSGDLVVMGAATVAGVVDGDVFAAGDISLADTASIGGDLSTVGRLSMDEGADIQGEIVSIEENEFSREYPISVIPTPRVSVRHRPFWLQWLINVVRAFIHTLVIGVLALVIFSIWPQQTERIAHVIEEVPLISFGMGVILFLLSLVIAIILIATICLSPFGFIGLIMVGVGTLMGWVAMGLAFGRRILTGLFKQTEVNPVTAAILGSMALTLVLAMTRMSGLLHTLMVFMLLPPAAGAVLLTRFGSMPYATQGRPVSPTSRAPQTPSAAEKHRPIVPSPLPTPPASPEGDAGRADVPDA